MGADFRIIPPRDLPPLDLIERRLKEILRHGVAPGVSPVGLELNPRCDDVDDLKRKARVARGEAIGTTLAGAVKLTFYILAIIAAIKYIWGL